MYRDDYDTEWKNVFDKVWFYYISFSALDGRERILFGMIKVKIKAIIYFL